MSQLVELLLRLQDTRSSSAFVTALLQVRALNSAGRCSSGQQDEAVFEGLNLACAGRPAFAAAMRLGVMCCWQCLALHMRIALYSEFACDYRQQRGVEFVLNMTTVKPLVDADCWPPTEQLHQPHTRSETGPAEPRHAAHLAAAREAQQQRQQLNQDAATGVCRWVAWLLLCALLRLDCSLQNAGGRDGLAAFARYV
jgi:hypothetical protein